MKKTWLLLLGAAFQGAAGFVADPAAAQTVARADTGVESVAVTARLRPEDAQSVPVSLSVVDGANLTVTRTDNTQQLQFLAPSLNYGSPNPRNTSYTIRGLGSSVVAIAQSNDGLEPGVGFYVDGVYHARPATAAFDFTDIDRVEILRGPQGTVFGKNSTAGAISIVTKAPSFDFETRGELSGGDFGYFQAKGYITGPISDEVALRLSGAITQRGGVLYNAFLHDTDNDIGTLALRGQLLYQPNSNFHLRFSVDYTQFVSHCCTQVYVTVGQTLKAASRQFPAMAAALNYTPPSTDPYRRVADIDAALAVNTDEGGMGLTADWNLGAVTLTSITGYRWWNWDAANDRDYTSIPVQLLQHIPSYQRQMSQEFRVASNGTNTIDYVAGLYWFYQRITGTPITGYGSQATFWLLGPAPQFPTNLLDGYRTDGFTRFNTFSYAAYGEATWHVTEALSVTGGIRYTYEDKDGSYATTVSGGLATSDPTLINAKLSILRPQSYTATVSDGSPSGRGTISYQIADGIMAYGTYARASKSGGINMSGLPLNPSNLPALSTAVIRPEQNTTWEVGFKTRLLDDHLLLNIDGFDTTVRDFQANVVDTGPGALRGYLANIEKVRVQGVELDSNFVVDEHLSGHFSATYSAGKYASYKNGPCPLESIASSTTVCDLSGRPLSGLPLWALSLGGEYAYPVTIMDLPGQAYLHGEYSYRSKMYGDPSDSRYTLMPGYNLLTTSLGLRDNRWDFSVWVRNLTNEHYLQNVTVQAGNSGLVLGTPGDPRMAGVTLRATF
ncbi:MAG TPA: TonB-dependent receptor [Rhizomicrobium sp.]|nr:TonB-dependent receptor [Rhizomicrobium sp.]